uniref:Uncharacterized protein n=1 Tax=Anguilla anguilla TaxID=7936 RepID=A0A0E9RIE9_ANGAN
MNAPKNSYSSACEWCRF